MQQEPIYLLFTINVLYLDNFWEGIYVMYVYCKYIPSLSVRLYQINVKTAEPVGSRFLTATHLTQGTVKIKNVFFERVLFLTEKSVKI